jgi:hypothetical protein
MVTPQNQNIHPAVHAFRTSGISDFLSSVIEAKAVLHDPQARILFLTMLAQTFVSVAAGEMSRQAPEEDNLEVLFDHIRTQVAKAGGLS